MATLTSPLGQCMLECKEGLDAAVKNFFKNIKDAKGADGQEPLSIRSQES